MTPRKHIAPWQIILGFLFIAALGTGLGVTAGTFLVIIRVIFEPPWRSVVALAAMPIVLYYYFHWVWKPLWNKRFTNYFEEAQARARRRKSPWNLLLPLFMLPAWAALWYGSFELLWKLHVLFYPAHAGFRRQFWTAGIGLSPFVSSFLMVFGPFAPTLGVAMLVGNALVWLVEPARQMLNCEAQGFPDTDFVSAQRELIRFTIWALVIGVGVGVAGAITLSNLH